LELKSLGESPEISDLELKLKRKKLELDIAEKELDVAKARKALWELENIEKGGEGEVGEEK